jgi:hypothetical protein
LLESVRRSLQVQGMTLHRVPQSVFGARQLHSLPSDVSTQRSPGRHSRPQPPQFAGSVVVSVQTPLQHIPVLQGGLQGIVVVLFVVVVVVADGSAFGAHKSLVPLAVMARLPN